MVYFFTFADFYNIKKNQYAVYQNSQRKFQIYSWTKWPYFNKIKIKLNKYLTKEKKIMNNFKQTSKQ